MTTRSEGPGDDAPWRRRLPDAIRPYFEAAPLAALFLGVSSGFAFSMIGATLTTRLAQHGVTKSAVTAFALTFLAYNFKFLWAPLVDPGIVDRPQTRASAPTADLPGRVHAGGAQAHRRTS